MSDLRSFLRETFDHDPRDIALFERALTHGSVGKESYERLEFVGDRIVGLAIARWLYERFPNEPEGKLSRRHWTSGMDQAGQAGARGRREPERQCHRRCRRGAGRGPPVRGWR